MVGKKAFVFPGRERGVVFLFPVRRMGQFVTTLMPTHKIKDFLSARLFPSEGGSAKSSL